MARSTSGRAREKRQKKRQAEQNRIYIIAGVALAIAVGLIALLTISATRPRAGEAVVVPANATEHVTSSEEVSSRTDPPTGGPHYANSASAGFYEAPIDDGLLMHSLEHGYVIVWFDCAQIDNCQIVENQISDVVTSGPKLIGMPRAGMETPIALTSWDRIERLDGYDEAAIRRFIRDNLNRSPEPDAQ